YNDGVRIMTLTWNYENSLGFPNSRDPELHKKGLKPFGIEAVRRMNELGMIVDVSHLSEGGFYDVAKHSEKPFVATHSCSRALCSHQRNLTDDQLRTLADCGGVVGINFNGPFLADGAQEIDTDAIVRHAQHMYNVAGIDTLAWGSDFDGIGNDLEIRDASGIQLLYEALKEHYSEEDLEKIFYRNVLRVYKEVWK
ncbi:MAG: membrane dipeptidase, partial [Erysipelotrichaceae bacterium]|nr:membrane dipeptidase [Erysipelotrichaceae bacterium]